MRARGFKGTELLREGDCGLSRPLSSLERLPGRASFSMTSVKLWSTA